MKFKFPIQFLLATIPMLIAAEGRSANISYFNSPPLSYVLIEGEIRKGDFEKFIDAVLIAGSRNADVFIASNGGDVLEAMKIGRYIRKFRFETNAPIWFEKVGGVCRGLPVPNSNCVCNSSCVLIYLAGAHRYGSHLGIHRTFVEHDQLRHMEMDEAAHQSKLISATLERYLDEMGAPNSLLEKMERIASSEIEYLDDEFIEKNLGGYAKQYQEWMIAKCGNDKELDTAMRAEPDDKKSEEIFKQLENVWKCQSDLLEQEQSKVFYETIVSAFKDLDPTLIPRHSLLKGLQGKLPFELTDLIGKSSQEAADLLSLTGLGNDYTVEELHNLHGQVGIFDNSLRVNFDIDGTVSSFTVPFFSSKDDSVKKYLRHFLMGLSSDSNAVHILDKYGRPNKTGCFDEGPCWMIYSTQVSDMQVNVSDDKSLHSVVFYQPGHWERLIKKTQ